MGVAAGFALFGASLALATPSTPTCTPAHQCHHVLHAGPSGSSTAHASWDSKERFTEGPLAVTLNYSPRLEGDAALRIRPVGDCAQFFVVPARFTGFASRCGEGLLPLHVQVANVHRRHLRIGVTYWVPAPLFTG